MTDRTPEQDDARRRVDAALAGMLHGSAPVDGQLREQMRLIIADARKFPDYCTDDEVVDAILPVLSSAIAEAKAEAWDEGWGRGSEAASAVARQEYVAAAATSSNPYRTTKED